MSSKRKELSNSFSTGGGGPHFEAHVQASYVTLMLTGGYAPCLPCWPITEIKLQGKIDGFDTDDLIVFVQNPDSGEKRKLLGQVKHAVRITKSSKVFGDIIQAAWDDFCDTKHFTKGKDVITVISGSLTTTDTEDVCWLLDKARYTKTPEEFIRHVDETNFSSDQKRKKLAVFQEQLRKANKGQILSYMELHDFLKHFHLLGYDLGKEEGVVLSLLHSHISQFNGDRPRMIWGRIVDIVQTWNQNAGTITRVNLPEDLLDEFRPQVVEEIPEAIVPRSPLPIPQLSNDTYSHNLAQAFLIGSWNEDRKGDIEIASELSDEDYVKWIPPIREALEMPDSPLGIRNGVWTTKRNLKTWEQLGKKLYDSDLNRLEKVAVKVLSEPNPAFELPEDERYMANVLGKEPRFSQSIRGGIADGLAVLGSHPKLFPHCTDNKPETVALLVVRRVLSDAEWQVWGSLNNQLPLLAEAAPGEFLSAVEKALKSSSCPFLDLFAQEGSGVMGSNYMTGLLWALETLAWDEQYLTRVAVILGELSALDPGGNWGNRPISSLITMFLPWLPQTTGSIEKRLIAIRTLVKEVPEVAWHTLISLLPNQHQISSGSHKPRWRMEIPDRSDKRIPIEDYWEQVSGYTNLALQIAGSDVDRLVTLIDAMNKLMPEAFDTLLTHLQSDAVISMPEEERTRLWSALVEFTTRHRRFSDADWALSEERVTHIDEVAAKLSPEGLQNLYRRLFSDRNLDLYDEYEGDDWEEKERKLEAHRQDAIGAIYKEGGIEVVLNFAQTVESALKVGAAFGVIAGVEEDRALLPRLLDTENEKLSRFTSSYIWTRQRETGWDWVDQIISCEWTPDQLSIFFRSLPFCPNTWKQVETALGENQSVYWKNVFFNAFQAKNDYATAIDKLLEYGRPYAAIDCLNASRHSKNPIDHDRTIKALLDAVSADEPPNSNAVYECVELIKALQDDPGTDQDALFKIEWAYLNVLGGHWGARPKVLEHRLASDPAFYCEIVRLIFRSQHEEKRSKESTEDERNIASHAYRLLDDWRTIPGTSVEGSFSPDAFKIWLDEVKEISEKTGHLEVALLQLGKVLICAPPDPGGLWMHIAIADAFNAKDAEDMRTGLWTGVMNSRGVHAVDPTGKPERDLAEKYRIQADEAESAGFFRLATTMRSVSDSYMREAERVVAEHQAELERYDVTDDAEE